MTSKVSFDAGTSTDTFKDADGAITKTKEYTTSYAVNKDTGEVTVADYAAVDSADKAVDDTKYKPTIGATVNLNSAGKLTTDTTSAGTATKILWLPRMLLSALSTNSVHPRVLSRTVWILQSPT